MVYVTRKGLRFSPLKNRAFLAVGLSFGLASTALVSTLWAGPDALSPEDFPSGFFSQGSTHSGAVFRHKQPAIHQGKIFMRRQTAALPYEELDDRIARIAGGIATKKQKETKDFAQKLTEHELALLEQETAAKINQASSQAFSQLQETEFSLKSYTNEQLAARANALALEVAKLRQQADVAEERAKRYSAEKTLDMRENLLVKLAEQQAAMREAESRMATKFNKTETGLIQDFNKLQAAVKVGQAENKRYTAEQLLEAQRMLSAVDAENMRRTWQAVDLVQARETRNREDLARIQNFVELGPQLAEERAKRFALEQNDRLQRDVKDTLRETQLVMATNQADVSKRLADLRGEVAVRAEENKRYAAEQAHTNRLAMLENRQHTLDKINRLEQQLILADATMQGNILAQLQETREQLQAQDTNLQAQLAGLSSQVTEQTQNNHLALLESRQKTKDQINRLERELVVADATTQAKILSQLQSTRAQLQQQDNSLQLQLAALSGKVDTRAEENLRNTAEKTSTLGQRLSQKLADYRTDMGEKFAKVQGQINTTAAENKRYTAEKTAANRMATLESRERTMAEIQRLERELIAADSRTQQDVLAQLQENLSQLKSQDANLQTQLANLSGQVDSRSEETKRYMAENIAQTQAQLHQQEGALQTQLASLAGQVDARAEATQRYVAENTARTQAQLHQQEGALQTQLASLSGKVDTKTEEAKRYTAERTAQTQQNLAGYQADVQQKLATLAGQVNTRAAEAKQYTAEQIAATTAELLENRRQTPSKTG